MNKQSKIFGYNGSHEIKWVRLIEQTRWAEPAGHTNQVGQSWN